MEGEVLRDDQWERLKPFVPGGMKGKRGPRSDARRFFEAVADQPDLEWLAIDASVIRAQAQAAGAQRSREAWERRLRWALEALSSRCYACPMRQDEGGHNQKQRKRNERQAGLELRARRPQVWSSNMNGAAEATPKSYFLNETRFSGVSKHPCSTC